MDYRTKTCCIIDHGIYTSWAERMAREFGRVMYFNPWECAYPSSLEYRIGHGLKGVEPIAHLWEAEDMTDLFVCLDVYAGDTVDKLRKDGKRVWGSGKAMEQLEIERSVMKGLMQKQGMPLNPWREVIGIDALKSYLKKNEDKHIKIEITRDDMESWHHKTWDLSEPHINYLEHKLGPLGKIMKFIVEDDIKTHIETGSDGWSIDGKYPDDNMQAFEIKDQGAITAHQPFAKMPEPIRDVLSKLSPVLRERKYRGNLSTEIRVGDDKKNYLIDMTCRMPNPPSSTHQELITNWADIMWQGADGVMVQPKYNAIYGVEVMIKSEWAKENQQVVSYPKEIDRWIKLSNACIIDGNKYVIPQVYGLEEIGSVVAISDSLLDCIKQIKARASQIKGYKIDIDLSSILDGIKEIHESINKHNFMFGDNKIPSIEEVARVLNEN